MVYEIKKEEKHFQFLECRDDAEKCIYKKLDRW